MLGQKTVCEFNHLVVLCVAQYPLLRCDISSIMLASTGSPQRKNNEHDLVHEIRPAPGSAGSADAGGGNLRGARIEQRRRGAGRDCGWPDGGQRTSRAQGSSEGS